VNLVSDVPSLHSDLHTVIAAPCGIRVYPLIEIVGAAIQTKPKNLLNMLTLVRFFTITEVAEQMFYLKPQSLPGSSDYAPRFVVHSVSATSHGFIGSCYDCELNYYYTSKV